MADSLCFAIDAMGGDHGPLTTVPATLKVLEQQPQLTVVLLGDEQQIRLALPANSSSLLNRLTIRHCGQSVGNDEKPSSALRHRRDSSMWLALKMVADGEAQACISGGNTGALMAMSLIQLRCLPGISRPAICTTVPTTRGHTYLLDMGANLECSAQQLHQFAIMATLAAEAVDGCQSPSVGLLNIGAEEIKGRQEIQDAAELLKADANINYCGFVEGNGLFQGEADIVVCDGFSGNVALKTGEGVAAMITGMLQESLQTGILTQLAALLAKPALKRFKSRIDPDRYNGASLLGINGVVVKSHGGASQAGFGHAVETALHEVEHNVPALITDRLMDNNS